ncbi:hypothetical protein Q1695_005864 [Nippostrongylus brasiliensis]|nr:hypothetical protein Q1695_005864 [Nippostrongylus brasiliensis]
MGVEYFYVYVKDIERYSRRVMDMGVHRTRFLFSNYETFFVPVADAFIR